MINFVVTAIIILIVAAAAGYVIRAKKRGVKCVGCPYGENCTKKSCGGCNKN